MNLSLREMATILVTRAEKFEGAVDQYKEKEIALAELRIKLHDVVTVTKEIEDKIQ